jgi:hypothetical protein
MIMIAGGRAAGCTKCSTSVPQPGQARPAPGPPAPPPPRRRSTPALYFLCRRFPHRAVRGVAALQTAGRGVCPVHRGPGGGRGGGLLPGRCAGSQPGQRSSRRVEQEPARPPPGCLPCPPWSPAPPLPLQPFKNMLNTSDPGDDHIILSYSKRWSQEDVSPELLIPFSGHFRWAEGGGRGGGGLQAGLQPGPGPGPPLLPPPLESDLRVQVRAGNCLALIWGAPARKSGGADRCQPLRRAGASPTPLTRCWHK